MNLDSQGRTFTDVFLPRKFAPNCVHDVIRVGSKYDGGYDISLHSIQNSDFLLSLGMSEDWRFEKNFLAIKLVPMHIYDHTVTPYWLIKNAFKNSVKALLGRYPKESFLLSLKALVGYRKFVLQENVKHYLEKIVRVKVRSNETSLIDAIARTESSNIFLKMDIEGDEYRVLDQVVESLERISAMAIEFHDLDLFENRFDEFIEKIQFDFRINSLNINNFGLFSESGFPPVIELSVSRCIECKSRQSKKIEAATCITNNPFGPQYRIRYK